MSEQVHIKEADGKGSFKDIEAPANIFSADIKTNLLHQSVRQNLAGKRAGTHTVKTRAEVRGGGAKPWRQKGTGRARAGTKSSPIWVGGGVAHGPKQKSYNFRVNKKEKKQALCSALSARVSEEKLIVLKNFEVKEINTKKAVASLEKAGIDLNYKTLVVQGSADENLSKSLRNHRNIKLCRVDSLNVYDIMSTKTIALLGDSLDKLTEKLS